MPVTQIDGKLVGLYVSENVTNPTTSDWKEVVCSQDTSLEGTSNTTSVATRCGTLKAKGVAAFTMPIAGIASTTPATGEVSADDLIQYFIEGTDLAIKLEHKDDATIYSREGMGFLSGYTEAVPVEGLVGFTGTVEISGDITYTTTTTGVKKSKRKKAEAE